MTSNVGAMMMYINYFKSVSGDYVFSATRKLTVLSVNCANTNVFPFYTIQYRT